MRIEKIKIYTFGELSADAKVRALDACRDYQVDGMEWWEATYDDAENVGLKLSEFELDRYCRGSFIESAIACARAIVAEHGPDCETFKTAEAFIKEFEALVDDDRSTGDAEAEFLRAILEDYRIMLRQEYEYLQSDESVAECIEANGYEFLENGARYV